jgi:hypothetical protein
VELSLNTLIKEVNVNLKSLNEKTMHNFALLQWLVVDGIEQCSLKTLFRRTRQTSSDKSATASNAGRYAQGEENFNDTNNDYLYYHKTPLMKKILYFLLLFILYVISEEAKGQYYVLQSINCCNGNGYNIATEDNGLTSDGTYLYGVAEFGGTSNNAGGIFKIKFDSTNLNYLYEFITDTISTYKPHNYGSLLLDNDTLYGVSSYGGIMAMGMIYKIKTDGTGHTDIFSFKNDTSTGYIPESPLITYHNVLYGKTMGGGSPPNSLVYKINKDGTGFKKLRVINQAFESMRGNILLKDSFLYAMTNHRIFKIDLNNDTSYYQLYYSASSNLNGIIIKDSSLYCVDALGGLFSDGQILKMKLDGSNCNTVFSFNNATTTVRSPLGNICLHDSTFYGFANGGEFGNGVIYQVNINGTGFKKLFDFYSSMITYTGTMPNGYLYFHNNTLYGITQMSYSNCYGGKVFRFKLGQRQTSNIVVNNITDTSANISWIKGNGEKRVVFLKKGTGIIPPPTDYIYNPFVDTTGPYNDTATYYCIYNDTGSTVTISHLRPDTIYTLHAFEYSFIINGGQPDYYDIDTIENPITFNTLTQNIQNSFLFNDKFIIYPNPTTNKISIIMPHDAIIEILNIEGQIIKTICTAEKQTTIDVADLSSGVYIIKAKTDRGVAVKKFIKE